MHIVMLSAALTPYSTTRMPVLWLCVGMGGTGIGVVFGELNFIPLSRNLTQQSKAVNDIVCVSVFGLYSDRNDLTGLVIAALIV